MLRRVLLKVPFMGLTATTIAMVQHGIVHSLSTTCSCFSTGSFRHKNPFYGVNTSHLSQSFFDDFVMDSKYNVSCGSILTYCTTVKGFEQKNQLKEITEQRDAGCGNCENFIGNTRKREMSKESFLLLFCIRSCGDRWGLNMPIDILCGSRSRKIIEKNYDKLPVHGHGKEYTPAWWKTLARLLIAHGYLKEVVDDVFRKVSVTLMGLQYLHSVNFSYQPPLILELSNEMIDEKDHIALQGNIDNNKGSTDVEGERLSEAEKRLYDILLHLRMELAKDSGIAPFLICGDRTLIKIAKVRPSTIDGLANIANQHLLSWYGDKFLETVRNASQELDLSLDGKRNTIIAPRKVYTRSENNANPAKFEAWKAWQVDKKTLKEVAALGRSVPIKEQTVTSYIIESAHTGSEVDWARFCSEIGLTLEIFSQIQSAVSKIGSRDRLRPIKDELPENVSYDHIKTHLALVGLNVPVDEIFGCSSTSLPVSSPNTERESFEMGKTELKPTPEADMDRRKEETM